MLEARSYYHPQYERSTGYAAEIIIGGVNRGCEGFKFKYEAEKWLKNNLEDQKKYFCIYGDKLEKVEILKL